MERAAPARARVSDAGPARLLAGVVGAAARLCGARLASISLLTEGRDHLELRSVFGTGGVVAEQRLPVRQSLNGTVITSARSRAASARLVSAAPTRSSASGRTRAGASPA